MLLHCITFGENQNRTGGSGNKQKFTKMKTSKNSLHSHMVGASRERKSLSGAIKVSKIDNPANRAFWREVADMCTLTKADVDPKFIIDNASEKELGKFDKAGLRTGDRAIWSAWTVMAIVRRYAIDHAK